MIYTHCLVVGRIFPYYQKGLRFHRLPPTEGDAVIDYLVDVPSMFESPALALLSVCRSIRQEGEYIVYQQNEIVLPDAVGTKRFFRNCLNTMVRRIWVKSVEIGLDIADMTSREEEDILDQEIALYRKTMLQPDTDNLPTLSADQAWNAHMHDTFKMHLVSKVWPRKMYPVWKHLELDELKVRLQDAACLDDCCAMPTAALLAFCQGFHYAFPENLELLGLPMDEIRFHEEFSPEEVCKALIEHWHQVPFRRTFRDPYVSFLNDDYGPFLGVLCETGRELACKGKWA